MTNNARWKGIDHTADGFFRLCPKSNTQTTLNTKGAKGEHATFVIWTDKNQNSMFKVEFPVVVRTAEREVVGTEEQGTSSEEEEEEGDSLQQPSTVSRVDVQATMTWERFDEEAKEQGGRLPTATELQAALTAQNVPPQPKDSWIPVSRSDGQKNDWVQDSEKHGATRPTLRFAAHSEQHGFPAWGKNSSPASYRPNYFYLLRWSLTTEQQASVREHGFNYAGDDLYLTFALSLIATSSRGCPCLVRRPPKHTGHGGHHQWN
jgi:hypothetical protein